MQCPSCGTEVSDGNICPICGIQIVSAPEPKPVNPVQPPKPTPIRPVPPKPVKSEHLPFVDPWETEPPAPLVPKPTVLQKIGTALSWVFSVIFLCMGISGFRLLYGEMSLLQLILICVLYLGYGLMLLPPLNRFLKRKKLIPFYTRHKVISAVLFTAVMLALLIIVQAVF